VIIQVTVVQIFNVLLASSLNEITPVDPVMYGNDECLPQLRSNGVLIGDWLCLKLSDWTWGEERDRRSLAAGRSGLQERATEP